MDHVHQPCETQTHLEWAGVVLLTSAYLQKLLPNPLGFGILHLAEGGVLDGLEEQPLAPDNTPPGYEADTEKRYPMLYLLHGYSDHERTWSNTGRAGVIMDNLIAEGTATLMVTVMPYGYAPPAEGDNSSFFSQFSERPADWGRSARRLDT